MRYFILSVSKMFVSHNCKRDHTIFKSYPAQVYLIFFTSLSSTLYDIQKLIRCHIVKNVAKNDLQIRRKLKLSVMVSILVSPSVTHAQAWQKFEFYCAVHPCLLFYHAKKWCKLLYSMSFLVIHANLFIEVSNLIK